MGRPSEGWKLRPPRGACRNYTVRFRWGGEDFERSTRTADPERAAEVGARIYAATVASGAKRKRHPAASGLDLEGAVRAWLASLATTHDPATVGLYLGYAERWLEMFGATLTTSQAEAYMEKRLGQVRASTVRKELSALRTFARWGSERGRLPTIEVPYVPKRATGTAYEARRRSAAVELSPAEVTAILAALPRWSSSPRVERFPIRARFIVQYETGLRPELVDLLSTPEHYRKGSTRINVTADLDKGRWARRVPLSDRARRELDQVLPKAPGLIFGRHDYRPHLRKAARAVLPPDRAEVFNGSHLRSARATHWLDASESLTGVQYLLGHRQLSTTARYAKASEAAAAAIVRPKRRRRR